jgi:hypothetical protein
MITAVAISNPVQEVDLNEKEIKKLLTGLGFSFLIAVAGLSMNGCASP